MPRRLIRLSLFLALCLGGVLAASAGRAREPLFELPVACQLGATCFVQNYVDQAPGPQARDFTCGPLTYDGHTGTDFRVPTLGDMRKGVPVLAAADGVVKAIRDGMADIHVGRGGRESIAGREAGNGIVLDHGDGWETQYSHLRLGSLRVKPGDRIRAGQEIALIGHSGLAEFPHVEFVVRHNGQSIDPFSGLAKESSCGDIDRSLWSGTARDQLGYLAGGLLASGFAAVKPDLETALDSGYADAEINRQSSALVFWAAAWGLRKGDRETFRLIDPKGRVVAEGSFTLDRDKAQWFRFVGRQRPAPGWPRGTYRGEYSVTRDIDGQAVKLIERSANLAVD